MSTQLSTNRMPATPVTPAAQKQQQPTPTGKWKHPKFDEITRRQYAATFDDRNVRTILANGAVLALSWVAFNATPKMAFLRALQTYMINFQGSIPYSGYGLNLIRLVFLYNILYALYPLFLRYHPDEVTDIPLTPSQRTAMGLDPKLSTPQTPGSAYASPNYVTPPRYQRSTPRTSFSTGDRQSPLSGSPRASFGVSSSNSPFSPENRNGSPLFQKALGGSAQKRMSFDSRGSPFAASSMFSESTSSTPSTPTPGTGKASVGLNNKWLYEKRRDSRGSGMFS